MKRLSGSLYAQVLVAVMLGIVVGKYFPDTAIRSKPLGDGFIKLIKMMISPLLFCTIVTGIAGMGDMKKLGRVGIKTLVYFEIVTTFSLAIGLIVVNVLKPGGGMNINPATLDPNAISAYTAEAKAHHVSDFLLNTIPSNIGDAFARGDILQILIISILFGYALSSIRQATGNGQFIIDWIEQLSQVFFKMTNMIMKIAPIGAFGAMAFTVGSQGTATLAPLAKLMGSFYLTCVIFICGVLGLIARVAGINIFKLIRYLSDEIFLVLGTSSSESALPRLLAKLEALGCGKSVVGLVIPAGYSFNLDGTSIYLTMAALFIAQATNTPLDLGQQLAILGVLLISSKGAAGVTGSGFITLAATLSAVPSIPVSGLVLILGIDRFMSEARAITNLIGNSVATIVIAKSERELDFAKAKNELG